MVLVGCTNNSKDNNSSINEKSKENSNGKQGQDETLGKYNAQGRIVKIDETGIHVEVSDKFEKYNVANETYDYKNRFTPTGEAVKRVT